MKLTSTSFRNKGVMPGRLAFAVKDPKQRVHLSKNLNPQLAWSGAPEGTKSFVLLCVDGDAPTRADDVNKAGREVPFDLPRGEFLHWAVVDIPAQLSEIAEGSCSSGVTARGKAAPAGPEGSRQGQNDYTGWFKGDANMEGSYLGYDGPCPPWNDSRVHHYRFDLYATDLDSAPVKGAFGLAEVRKALEGHVLAQASLTGRYSLNPRFSLK